MKGSILLRYGLLLALFRYGLSLGHGGHDSPGAVPPAPHGGIAKEAADVDAHDHHEEKPESHEEKEIFAEALYKNQKLRLYPLALAPEDPSSFLELKPTDFKNVSARVEFPRQKRFETLVLTNTPEGWETVFDAKRAHRFIVHLSFVFNGEAKQAKIQIETL